MVNKVAISTLPYAFSELSEQCGKIKRAGADFLHCDIMDGMFVPQKTFMPKKIEELSKICDLPLDVHLMMQTPSQYLSMCANAYSVSIHCEVFNSVDECIQTLEQIKMLNLKAGIAIDLYTQKENVLPFLDVADYVLVMSVKAGKGGQTFNESALQKVRLYNEVRLTNSLPFKIEIDGGINASNAKMCVDAGADILVSGSYVANSNDYNKVLKTLKF